MGFYQFETFSAENRKASLLFKIKRWWKIK